MLILTSCQNWLRSERQTDKRTDCCLTYRTASAYGWRGWQLLHFENIYLRQTRSTRMWTMWLQYRRFLLIKDHMKMMHEEQCKGNFMVQFENNPINKSSLWFSILSQVLTLYLSYTNLKIKGLILSLKWIDNNLVEHV